MLARLQHPVYAALGVCCLQYKSFRYSGVFLCCLLRKPEPPHILPASAHRLYILSEKLSAVGLNPPCQIVKVLAAAVPVYMIDAEAPVGLIAQNPPIQRIPLRKHIGCASGQRNIADEELVPARFAQGQHTLRPQRPGILDQQPVVNHQHHALRSGLLHQFQKQRQSV